VRERRFQHSPILGQEALSRTVERPSSRTRRRRSENTSPAGSRARIQGGWGRETTPGGGGVADESTRRARDRVTTEPVAGHGQTPAPANQLLRALSNGGPA
jgi:hypothetical protein